jgi:hypothetical protein
MVEEKQHYSHKYMQTVSILGASAIKELMVEEEAKEDRAVVCALHQARGRGTRCRVRNTTRFLDVFVARSHVPRGEIVV